MDHLIIRLKKTKKQLNLPPDAPSKWRTLLEFIKIPNKNTSFDVYDSHDLAPFLYEAKSYLKDTLVKND